MHKTLHGFIHTFKHFAFRIDRFGVRADTMCIVQEPRNRPHERLAPIGLKGISTHVLAWKYIICGVLSSESAMIFAGTNMRSVSILVKMRCVCFCMKVDACLVYGRRSSIGLRREVVARGCLMAPLCLPRASLPPPFLAPQCK